MAQLQHLIGDRIVLKDQQGRAVVTDEAEGCKIIAQFKDGTTDINLSQLGTVTLTLFNDADNSVINLKNGVDIKNNNNATISAGGELTLRLTSAENIIVDPDTTLTENDVEQHIARISWTWNDGVASMSGSQEFQFGIRKLATVS